MKIKKNIILKDYTTFKIGGPAKFFCEVKTLKELKKAISWAGKHQEEIFILGGGSNVLFMDEGFNGLVIKISNEQLEISPKEDNQREIKVGAGVLLANLVNYASKNNLTGLEWAVGIPGTVGGAIRGNAGAFGGEMKDVVKKVKAISFKKIAEQEKTDSSTFEVSQCVFAYRNSWFKQHKEWLIWEAKIKLVMGEKEESQRLIKEYTQRRKKGQLNWLKNPSAGSIFKNPVATKGIIKDFEKDKEIKCKGVRVPAGWLIERVGLKGKRIGNIKTSDKQANIIINQGEGKSEQLIILISLIKRKVFNKFGILLEEEIKIVPSNY